MAAPTPFLPNIRLPPELDVDSPGMRERWLDWREDFERYLLLSGSGTQNIKFQSSALLQAIGYEARKIYKGFVYDDTEDKCDPKVLIKKYDEYFVSETRDFIERLVFSRREQEPHETFEQFLSALRFLAGSCNFCTTVCRDVRIMDRIIDGHKSQKVKDKLMSSSKLDLAAVLIICRSMELNDETKKVVKHTVDDVSRVSHQYTSKGGKVERLCNFCAKTHVMGIKFCPAWGKKCDVCKTENHFAGSKVCKNAPVKTGYYDKKKKYQGKKVHVVEESDGSSTEGSVSVVAEISAISKSKALYCKMLIDESEVIHQIDPGATVCILPAKYVGNRSIRDESVTLKMWNGTHETTLGRVKIKVRNPKTNKKWNVDYVVVENNTFTPLLSRTAAENMGLITVNYDTFEVCAVKSDFVSEFANVFDVGVGTLPGGTVHLTVRKDAEPVVRAARTLPEALKDDVREELDRHVAEGIMCKVDCPTDWVNQMSVVKKKSGAIRVCVDPRTLNKSLKREHYRLPVLDDVLPRLAGAKVFSVCDLKQGYHHVELDEESSYLTTFATPFGRFRWLRLPFGLNVSSEIFQKRLCLALEGLNGIQCVADDVIIYGSNQEEHDKNLRGLLARCQLHGIKLNNDKCQLNVPEIKFLGHVVSVSDPEKVEAIKKMERPADVAAVERLKGTVTYLARYVPNLTDVMKPITVLTHKDTEWCWGDPQEKAFNNLKKLLTEAPVLAYYDKNSDLVIQCDASGSGLGAALMQNGRPLAYASQALTPTETRYATIEKEMLAIVYSLEKWHQFTYGRPVVVHSDHKPLFSISKKPLDRAPKRLQSMLIRALAYDADIQYLEGKKMFIADTLSRAYLKNNENDNEAEFETVNAVMHLAMSEEQIAKIRTATSKDQVISTLKATIQHGWPDKKDVPTVVGEYYNFRDELAVSDGLVFRGERLVIPRELRGEMTAELHSGHTGVEGSLRRAREAVYWPGMTEDVRRATQKCEVCQIYNQAQQKEPLMSHEVPNRPWSQIGADIFTLNGKNYLVTVDYYSNFWEIDRLHETTSKGVTQKIKARCSSYGIPDVIVTDNGPQFVGEKFAHFINKWKIKHVTSSPHYAQSNGKAESAVKSAKRLLKRTDKSGEDPYLALLSLRNTPQQGIDLSPAQRLLGRRTKTLLPASTSSLKPSQHSDITEKLKFSQTKQKFYYDRNAKPLEPLEEGDRVRAKPYQLGDTTWKSATISKRLDDRSYEIHTDTGQSLRRNRTHLRPSRDSEKVATPDAVHTDTPAPPMPIDQPVNAHTPPTVHMPVIMPPTPRSPKNVPVVIPATPATPKTP